MILDPEIGFVAGTLVHTKDGLRSIEKIRVGDWVLSQPELTGGLQYKQVINTFVHEGKEVWLLQYFKDDDTEARNIVLTGNHPVWVKGVGWTRADLLDDTCILQLLDSSENTVYRVRRVLATEIENVGWTFDDGPYSQTGPTIDLRGGEIHVSKVFAEDEFNPYAYEHRASLRQRVYNIEVEGFHTHYVDGIGAWVHNAN